MKKEGRKTERKKEAEPKETNDMEISGHLIIKNGKYKRDKS